MCHTICVEVRGQFEGIVLTQVVRLGNQHLYLLSHLLWSGVELKCVHDTCSVSFSCVWLYPVPLDLEFCGSYHPSCLGQGGGGNGKTEFLPLILISEPVFWSNNRLHQ